MATPQITISLTKDMEESLRLIAKSQRRTVRTVARDLMKMAIDLDEDLWLAQEVKRAESNPRNKKTYTHEEVWSRYFGKK